jgi:hypothetical protein
MQKCRNLAKTPEVVLKTMPLCLPVGSNGNHNVLGVEVDDDVGPVACDRVQDADEVEQGLVLEAQINL